MQTPCNLPAAVAEELDLFKLQTERFQRGALSAAEYRSFRVPCGIYEQRQSGTYMMRVRLPAGMVLPQQMRVLAAVAKKYGSGVLHITTRQDIQVHRVLLDDLHPAMVELCAAGLSTKGGGGNTVRNITGCADAGVCPHEVFDVSPYVVALTDFLLKDPLSYQLPRKFKVACSGCAKDCAAAMLNDVGLIAKQRNGSLGFAVYVVGGMGASSRVADRLEEFVPAETVHPVVEAVKRVFDQHGNRRNKHRARLRFLLEQIGPERFRQLYAAQLASLQQGQPADLAVRQLPQPERSAPAGRAPLSPGFDAWCHHCTSPQKQPEHYLVHIPLALGNIQAETVQRLAEVVEQHREGVARATQRQGLVLRSVHRNELPELHAKLSDLGLAGSEPAVLRNLVACAGAATCRLGICLARGLAAAVRSALLESGLDLDALGDVKIHISGCPNACGRHPVGDIGLFGAARRVGGRLVPHYVLQLGGKTGEGQTRLAQGASAVPARNVPPLLVDLLRAFRQSAPSTDFAEFLESRDQPLAEQLARKYGEVPELAENKDFYFDWGAQEMFSLAGRGPGECGACST